MSVAGRLLDKSGQVILRRLSVADTWLSRLVGWQFRARPDADEGLLIVPCSSIHTCFLRFPLDLVMLDREGRVLAIRRNVKPWRAVIGVSGTYAILEMAHDASNTPFREDQVFLIDLGGTESIPESIAGMTEIS